MNVNDLKHRLDQLPGSLEINELRLQFVGTNHACDAISYQRVTLTDLIADALVSLPVPCTLPQLHDRIKELSTRPHMLNHIALALLRMHNAGEPIDLEIEGQRVIRKITIRGYLAKRSLEQSPSPSRERHPAD
jgi:hypothetical protein